MPSQGKQYSYIFSMFSEIHKRGGLKEEKDISLPCFVSCWLTQHHPNTRDKQGFKGSLRTW